MAKYLIVSEKTWHQKLVNELCDEFPDHTFALVNRKEDFNLDYIKEFGPEKIFIPHWSYMIDASIYNVYNCIVFHMTDLPFGRGGSPLQNLIVNGFSTTKISALKVVEELDAGPIYIKQELSLLGTAQEIFLRAADIIGIMISKIIRNNPIPIEQVGEKVLFKRRKPSESKIQDIESISKLYDLIRMLDAEGYPKAFVEIGEFKIEFSRASIKSDKEIIADVRIFKK
jgi:methionyl-tRNA formyltransferase